MAEKLDFALREIYESEVKFVDKLRKRSKIRCSDRTLISIRIIIVYNQIELNKTTVSKINKFMHKSWKTGLFYWNKEVDLELRLLIPCLAHLNNDDNEDKPRD